MIRTCTTDPFPGEMPADQLEPRRPRYHRGARAVEFLLALVMLAFLAPVILAAALLVKLTSPGPAFYSQTRVGKNGRLFRIFKLRTMVQDAESGTGAVWSSGAADPRVTAVGRILRNTHIDEFPQIINVLLGQMRLVGPRPERPEIVASLEWQIPLYRERLRVAPGVAGFAQLRLPPDSDLESVRRKLAYDLYYIRHASAWFDFKILFCTGVLFVGSLWRAAAQSLALPSAPTVESYVPLGTVARETQARRAHKSSPASMGPVPGAALERVAAR